MDRVTSHLSISLDGYVAGPDQSAEDPLGIGGEGLHTWMFAEERTAADRAAVAGMHEGVGAFVMGRNMFGHGRGEWDLGWRGWWGEDPPYHRPVFVLTHYPREPLEMEGGTTFHFVTDGPDAALEQARTAAGGDGVLVAGGASTVRQYLAAGAIDELELHVSPILLGAGERLFEDIGDVKLEPVAAAHSPLATHVRYRVAPA